jgi:predicted  nucleic acid-binding Zn-ribbon protein
MVVNMNIENETLLVEIRDLLKTLVESQKQLGNDISNLREEYKKLKEEIRLSNSVLNGLNARNEIVN